MDMFRMASATFAANFGQQPVACGLWRGGELIAGQCRAAVLNHLFCWPTGVSDKLVVNRLSLSLAISPLQFRYHRHPACIGSGGPDNEETKNGCVPRRNLTWAGTSECNPELRYEPCGVVWGHGSRDGDGDGNGIDMEMDRALSIDTDAARLTRPRPTTSPSFTTMNQQNKPRPSFDSLPSEPYKNAWGLYGADDELGALNLLTPEVIKRATQEATHGITIGLKWVERKSEECS